MSTEPQTQPLTDDEAFERGAEASIAPTVEEVLTRHDVVVFPRDMFGVEEISAVKVKDLRHGCLALLRARNVLAQQVGTGITELQHARQRITRLGLDHARKTSEQNRALAGAHAQINSITLMSNFNASRSDLLESVIYTLAQALERYATPGNWNGRELTAVASEEFGGAHALATMNDPVVNAVVSDVRGNARLRNYDESAAADARARAQEQAQQKSIAQALADASKNAGSQPVAGTETAA